MTDYAQAVSEWAEHLRSGGTTPWSAWMQQGAAEALEKPVDRPSPDALHLELVRRLNELSGPDTDHGALADLVLTTAAPGRGMLDVPLPWSGAGAPQFGTPPVDPTELPSDELIRMCVGVLAALLPVVPLPAAQRTLGRWPLPGRRRFRVHGSPGTATALTGLAVEQGAVESDWRPVHLVVARPVESMMAELWAANTLSGGILQWSALWRRTAAAGGLPPRIDPVGTATRLAATGARVHVLVGADTTEIIDLGARVLGIDPVAVEIGADPSAVDLLRRLNRLLALSEGPERVVPLVGSFHDRVLAPTGPSAPNLTAPRNLRRWALQQGRTAASQLADPGAHAGYAVNGDPGALTLLGKGSNDVDRDRTLGLALAACLRAWQLQEGIPRMDGS